MSLNNSLKSPTTRSTGLLSAVMIVYDAVGSMMLRKHKAGP